jgi:hypothetical protein
MSHPVYVLLPDGVEWTAVPGTTAQAPKPVRWYLRQSMLEAATQVAVLVDGEEPVRGQRITQVAHRAAELGGVAVDAETQQLIDLDGHPSPA